MNRAALALITLSSITMLVSCGKPSEIKKLEKAQINEILGFNVINMTVEELRYFENDIKDDHVKRLKFLLSVIEKEKTRGMSLLVPAKIQALRELEKLIQTDKVLYELKCSELHYNPET